MLFLVVMINFIELCKIPNATENLV